MVTPLSYPLRMIRIDYVPDFSIVESLEPEHVFKSLKEEWNINCVWLVGTLGFDGLGHKTTFDANGYEKYEKLGKFDYLRTYVPFAKKYGIIVIAYMNMHWYRYEFAEKHSEWEQVTSDGDKYGKVHPLYGNGATFCVNSPWRDWALGLLEEVMKTGVDGVFLDGPVIFPDCCYCEFCRDKFSQQIGEEIPREDWEDPIWKKFVEFRESSLSSFLKDAREKIKRINPEAIIFINSGGWAGSSWRLARDIQKLNPFQDLAGAEAFFHYAEIHNPYETLVMGKYLRAGKKPAVVFTHYMNGNWHYLNLPEGEIKRAIVQTAASNANHWLACLYPSLKYQPTSNIPVKELFEFIEANKELFQNTSSIADIGIVISSRTGKYWLSQVKDIYTLLDSGREENLIVDIKQSSTKRSSVRKRLCEKILTNSYEGYLRAIIRNHILFDILLDQDINYKTLRKYKAIVFPDAYCFDESSAEELKKYIHTGGNAIFSFEAGLYNEIGEPTEELFDLLGIAKIDGAFTPMLGENYIKITTPFAELHNNTLIERSDYALKILPQRNVKTYSYFMEPLDKVYTPLKDISKYPAIIINNFGRGKVIYFAEAIGQFFKKTGIISAEQRIIGAIKYLVTSPIISTTAPKTVSIELYKQKDRFILHLVNNTFDHRPVNEFIPLTNISITLSLPLQNPIAEIRPLRENSFLRTEIDDNRITLTIPQLKLYELIVIEPETKESKND